VQLYADLAERLWRAAGDTSTDLSWYSRRALAMGVYASTELYMLSDCSPGFADTWAALARRLDDAARLVPWR
jgi:ubiquinone biosynthesis protein COQ9